MTRMENHTTYSKMQERCLVLFVLDHDVVLASLLRLLWVSVIVKDRANEIYKKVEDSKSIRGRNQDAILAACLYIACRQEDKPCTVKGILFLVNSNLVDVTSCCWLRRDKRTIMSSVKVELQKSGTTCSNIQSQKEYYWRGATKIGDDYLESRRRWNTYRFQIFYT